MKFRDFLHEEDIEDDDDAPVRYRGEVIDPQKWAIRVAIHAARQNLDDPAEIKKYLQDIHHELEQYISHPEKAVEIRYDED